jgi:hypothetical protein
LERTPLAVTDSGEVLDVVHDENAIRIICTADRVDIREAALSACAADKSLVLVWDGFTVTLQKASLEKLVNSGCRKIGFAEQNDPMIGKCYGLAYYNSLGHLVQPTFSILLEANSEKAARSALYILQDDQWVRIGNEGLACQGTVFFRTVNVYGITVGAFANCDLSQLGSYADAGSTVNLRLSCKFGYEVSGAVVRMMDGTHVPVNGLCFVMPDGDVTVELTVTRIVYRVNFVVDGVVISEREYFLGEQIQIPAPPQKASDGTYDYTFGGWSRDVTVAYGDERTMVIEASFIATEIPAKDPYKSLHNNNLFLTVILPIVAATVVLTVGGLVFFKQRKKRKAVAILREPLGMEIETDGCNDQDDQDDQDDQADQDDPDESQ